MQESKQEVTKVISFWNIGGQMYPFTLKQAFIMMTSKSLSDDGVLKRVFLVGKKKCVIFLFSP